MVFIKVLNICTYSLGSSTFYLTLSSLKPNTFFFLIFHVNQNVLELTVY